MMKINHPAPADSLLPADFAPRVVQRVARIKRRRTAGRRAMAVTALLAITIGAVLAERRESVQPLQPAVALRSPRSSNWNGSGTTTNEPVSYQEQPQPPINLFLPDTYLMTNFEDSTGESSWHSYDSWWSSNS